MSKVPEATIQAVLMSWLMNEKHHIYVLPNSNQFFSWEADLLSVTAARLVHEFEVKISRGDFRRDCKKYKHKLLTSPFYLGSSVVSSPSYFWYATWNLQIVPPENSGWVRVFLDDRGNWKVKVEKDAPRLHELKINVEQEKEIARMLSWRITNSYRQYTIKAEATNGTK